MDKIPESIWVIYTEHGDFVFRSAEDLQKKTGIFKPGTAAHRYVPAPPLKVPKTPKKDRTCGIESSMGWKCDLPWGHPGTMHSSDGDGYYNRLREQMHRTRQKRTGNL